MGHEKPCCGAACFCDNEDTWNDPSECVQADDACDTCAHPAEDDQPSGVPSAPEAGGKPDA